MNTTPRVHLVEDDDAVRESLQMMLDSIGFETLAFANGNDFLAAYNQEMAGCIVLDIRMPGMDGMALQRELNQLNSILPIIFVTGHGDVPMAVEAMQQGAVDFVQKPYREQELLEKIRQAMALDEDNRNSLQQQQDILARIEDLTPREHDVMRLMVKGSTNKIIADELNISQRTVEIHRARVMEKLHAKSLAHLVRMTLSLESGAKSKSTDINQ